MGLSAPKNRSKLSHDPNNTAWSRNTQSFGHKILSSQGWAPGQTLGAEGAAHAQHYTAGSNSHIRVLLKDDQLGLGAKRGGNNAETFGLSLFSGILGRLNGKSEVQLEKEQTAQRDVELALYQSRKNGYINFVSAGFLVGDRIDKAELMKKEDLEKAKLAKPAKPAEEQSVDPQGTKRKRAEEAADEDSDSSSSSSSSSSDEQEQPSAKKTKSAQNESTADESDKTSSKSGKTNKSKKDKKNKKRTNKTSSSDDNDSDQDRAAKKARKAARRAEKEQRRAEKEARRAEKEERRRKKEAKRAAKSSSNTPAAAADSTPSSASATPQPFVGRHAARQRYIAAKGRAHLDPQALKEIFMVKAA